MIKLASIWTPTVQQQNYRALLQAISRPGRQQKITCSDTESDAMRAILATLLDSEVSLCDPDQQLSQDDWQMLQARRAQPEHADYIVCNGAEPPEFEPKLGTLPSPESAATLLISVASLTTGPSHIQARGPGIETTEVLSIAGLCEDWLTARKHWVSAFPLGIDIFLVDQNSVLALPRTTQLEVI